jgi:sec-independent protein translocase protein TatA
MDFGPQEILIVLVVILVLFGGSQLPKLAKNLGKAQREFKAGLDEAKNAAQPADAAATADQHSVDAS